MESISIKTARRTEFVDITGKINNLIEDFNIPDGAILICTKHTTSGLIVNENESGLVEDMENALKMLIPSASGYKHDRIDRNADSHLRSILISTSLVLPVADGRLDLGRWQSVFFVELDGPRTRSVVVKVF
ncbi:MAG: hypothetical protein A7316_06025 [Candidatus Altiarchaeales archaeon WOR_SM1_86-2]|nr:MAG: hypothetical protein A7316_06025 [Candidatus Altiarchaeales archaeon WOR_SM1_86-2]ODS41752.1 MAG: hypothetical protein A7315_00325 [Candidatus Altiarchaeales archaeon WOR_SM1_79]